MTDTLTPGTTKKTKRRWTVLFPSKAQYLGDGGGIAWTTKLAEAKQWATGIGGVVVDADWLSTGWADWRRTGIIPEEAKPCRK